MAMGMAMTLAAALAAGAALADAAADGAALTKASALTVEGGTVESCCVTDGCARIGYVLSPEPGSFIRCMVELPPPAKWNGRLWGLGSGGPGGYTNERGVHGWALGGSAAAYSDLGTSRGSGRPEVIRDFGHRATHLMTVTAKALVRAYYGRSADHAYFIGGSTGGGQGFHEVLRYPDDYDGVVSTVPANTRLPLHMYFAWTNRELRDADGRMLFTAEQLENVRKAALDALGADEPARARGKWLMDSSYSLARAEAVLKRAVEIDPSLDDPGLLARLGRIFHGPVIGERHIHSGVPFGADILPGAGNQWMLQWWLPKDRALHTVTDEELLRWEREYAPDCDACGSDVERFRKRGGKWIVAGGLEDSVVPYPSMIDWYDRTTARVGGLDAMRAFCRFYLMPGHAHGPGRGMQSAPDYAAALVDWVEKGRAPGRLEARMRDGAPLAIAPYPDRTTAE